MDRIIKYCTRNLTVSELIIPQVSTDLNLSDFVGGVMVRWGINRNKYRVRPGLYAIGYPGSDPDVFVTSNYKLSFDHLRKNLSYIIYPHEVFVLSGHKAYIVRRDHFMECRACALNCPVQAIKVNSGVGCSAGIINGILRNSEPTCNCSGTKTNCC